MCISSLALLIVVLHTVTLSSCNGADIIDAIMHIAGIVITIIAIISVVIIIDITRCCLYHKISLSALLIVALL